VPRLRANELRRVRAVVAVVRGLGARQVQAAFAPALAQFGRERQLPEQGLLSHCSRKVVAPTRFRPHPFGRQLRPKGGSVMKALTYPSGRSGSTCSASPWTMHHDAAPRVTSSTGPLPARRVHRRRPGLRKRSPFTSRPCLDTMPSAAARIASASRVADEYVSSLPSSRGSVARPAGWASYRGRQATCR
jgi:hypothetical protein